MASSYNSYVEERTRGVFFIARRSNPDDVFGTGFLVHRRRPDGTRRGYLVTCQHNVQNHQETEILLRFRDHEGRLHDASVNGSWVFSFDGMDLAVMPVAPPGVHVTSYSMDDTTEAAGWEPTVGARVETVGLLSKVSVMAQFAVPMVRSATLGASTVPIRHGEGSQFSMNGHLLDARFEQGASGSPVFAVFDHVDLSRVVEVPASLLADEERPNEGHVDLRAIVQYRLLFGMLVAQSTDELPRVGVVLPVEFIRQGLEWADGQVDAGAMTPGHPPADGDGQSAERED